ncbi:MAG: hypothetical protein NTX49_02485 [Chlamydiae bacterium]|nr:hypothetical protein [Chlamydiota bacterium]
MLKLLKILRSPSIAAESLLPLDVYRISENYQSLLLYECKRLRITYIVAFPWCKHLEIEKCKAALQIESNLKVWLIFKFPFLSWNMQSFIEKDGHCKCYFYQLQKGSWMAFDRRKFPIKGGRNYTSHPFSLNFERPYEMGLEGDFEFRMKTHKNFAKAIHQKLAFLQQRPRLWKSLNKKNTYKTAVSETYEFLLKKLES